jgi:predicted outer membrane repeat protein
MIVTRGQVIRRASLLFAVGACLLVAPAAAWSATLTVTTTSDSPASPGCDARECTLREAIAAADAAPGADTIVFRTSVQGTITLTQGPLVVFSGPLTINGPGAGRLAVSGNDTTLVLSVETLGVPAILEVRGLTLTRGRRFSGPGGAVNNAGRLTLRESRVTNSQASAGGGIVNEGGTLAVIDSQVTGNSAAHGPGGGIANGLEGIEGGSVTVDRSVISGNSSTDDGGAIFSNTDTGGGSLSVDRSVIGANSAERGAGILSYGRGLQTVKRTLVRDNTAATWGGGIYVGHANTSLDPLERFTLEDSQLTGNTARGAAGLWNADGVVTVKDSVVRDNAATESRGGIYNQAALTLERSAVLHNTAAAIGGGIENEVDATAEIRTSLIAFNRAQAGAGLALNGLVTLEDTIVTLNRATGGSVWEGRGGGILNIGALLTVKRSRLVANQSAGDGGGLYTRFPATFTDSAVLLNRADADGNGVGTGGGIFNELTTVTRTNTPVQLNSPNNCAGTPSAPPC